MTRTNYTPIAEGSQATPGLWNAIFSALSTDLDVVLSAVTSTFSSSVTVTGGVTLVGPLSVQSGVVRVTANSNSTDYIFLTDSSNQRSSYILGSKAGGTADGLNIWDDSGSTMIASFSKQSVRFWQTVIGPLVDTSGNVFNVKGYGATGAGLVDETAFFTSTAVAGGAGAHIVVPPGIYLVSALTLAYTNQQWDIASGATLKLKDSANTGAVIITAPGVLWRGGAIDCNKTNNAGATRADGIRVVSTGSIRIEGVIISNASTDGIRLETVSNAEIVGCQLINCGGLGVEVVSACSDVRISGCRAVITDGTITSTGIQIDGRNGPITGKYTADSNYRVHVIDCFASGHSNAGIYYNGSFEGTIVGCNAERNGDIGIDTEYTDRVVVTACSTRSNKNYGIASFQSSENCAFVGNSCRGDGTGIISGTTSTGITIVGNIVSSTTSNGIYVFSGSDANVTGNTVDRCGLDGIQLLTSSFCVVSGNRCRNNGHHGININGSFNNAVTGNSCVNSGQSLAGMSGIVANGGAYQNTILGNVCGDSQASKTQAYGITTAAASDNSNVIVGNNVLGNFTNNMNLSGTVAILSSNLGY